jgi:hypothetical protein
MKKVLLVYYTQSGQLREIAEHFIAPLEEAGISVEKLSVQPLQPYPFPWNSDQFFDAMPESVLGIPTPLEPLQIREKSYDLVIFAYQPWFLSPSIPATAVLLDPQFRAVLNDTPVVTLIGSRNMWLNSQEKVKLLLQKAGAKLVGNVVLFDRHNNHVSAVTILYWMLTGKKDRLLGIFPKPGIADRDIAGAENFGELLLPRIIGNEYGDLQKTFVERKAIEVKYNLMFIEGKAGKIFRIWANGIVKKKNRKLWLKVFKYYLLFALFIVAPILLLFNNILIRPFTTQNARKKKLYYLGLN